VRVYGELRFEKRAMERDKFIGIVNNQRSIHSGLTPILRRNRRANGSSLGGVVGEVKKFLRRNPDLC
jgi:hypothetical protein